MIVDGCDAVVVLGSGRPNTGAFAEKRANLGSHHSCLAEGDRVDPNKKMMVEGFVATFAKAARVSDVPEEAITSDTREPSYMFLAAEWNRSTVSHEFEVEAHDFSLQIASSAMMIVETDRSPALIACADLAAAEDGET